MAESNELAPGSAVIVCLPALMVSGSTAYSFGKGPTPNNPFSL